MFGRAVVLQLAVFAAASIVGLTGALAAVRSSAPPPALSVLVLTPADFLSGATVSSQSTTKVSGVQLFARAFRPGARISGARLLGVVSIALLDADASTAAADYADFDSAARSKAGRQALARSWAVEFVKAYNTGLRAKKRITLKQTAAGAPTELGTAAVRMPITIKTSIGTLKLWFEVAQTDRAIAILELVSQINHALSSADAVKALTAEQQHLQDAFTVANTAPPTISGTPAQGQVLSVDEGTWTGAPSAFTYAWSRCDVSGANCVPIAGATTKTYTVTTADVASTLVVTVTGTNSVSNKSGASAATAVVT